VGEEVSLPHQDREEQQIEVPRSGPGLTVEFRRFLWLLSAKSGHSAREYLTESIS